MNYNSSNIHSDLKNLYNNINEGRLSKDDYLKKFKKDNEKDNNIYDFIIVGTGPTGCVLANRLSENGKYSVCVLEAGKDDARVEQTLPITSVGNIPQPNDFSWSKYIRGGIQYTWLLHSRGFQKWATTSS